MNTETFLTFIGPSCAENTVRNAINMAEQANAHLSIVIVGVSPQMYTYGYGMPYGGFSNMEQWSTEVKDISDTIKMKSDEVEKLVQKAGISAEVLMEYCETSLLQNAVMRHACVADRVVLLEKSDLAADVEDGIISGVMFQSPSALVHGKNSHLAAVNPKSVFIAWDSSSHCAAATRSALPLLKNAQDVTVGVFDPVKREGADGEEPGAELASWLSRHGCKVTVEQYPSGGEEIANCILKRAQEKGAELIVMGGYSHMKIRQQLFGGTTKTMLEQNKLPILIAHK